MLIDISSFTKIQTFVKVFNHILPATPSAADNSVADDAYHYINY